MHSSIIRPSVVAPNGGLEAHVGSVGTVHKVPAAVTDGRLAVLQHTLQPRHLAAPLHRHAREDELSFVLSGTLAVKLGDTVVLATAGSFVMKPKGQWHTCWNPGENGAANFLELLIPGGCDAYLEWLSRGLAYPMPDMEGIRRVAAEYGIELDLGGVSTLCRRYRLTFGWQGSAPFPPA